MTTSDTAARVHRFRYTPFDVKEAATPALRSTSKEKAPALEKLPIPAATPPAPTFSEKEVEAARAEGHARGLKEGSENVEAELKRKALLHEEATYALLEVIANRITIAAEEQAHRKRELQESAAKLALAIARKVAGDAIKREPYAHIETLVKECMGLIAGESKITIHVPPARAEGLRGRIDMLKPTLSGFEGQLVVEEDAALGEQDCRVEWKGGEAERNVEVLWHEIEALVAKATI